LALAHFGMAVEYIGDGRLVLSVNPFHPGARSGLEVRSVDQPSVVSFSMRSSWLKGGDLYCPTINGDWLVFTDVQDEPTMLSPGPPQAWKLVARNIATGEQRVLDTGTADMANEFACAVRDGDRLAWTSGHASETTLFDLRTWARKGVMLSGTPVGYARAGLVVARIAIGPRASAELVNPATGSHRPIAKFEGLYVQAGGNYLVWYERTSDDGSSGLLHVCELPTCPGGSAPNNAATVLDRVSGDNPPTAIGDEYVAWTMQDGTVTVRRIDGRGTAMTVDGYVSHLAADGRLLAFVGVTNAGTPQEKDVLHLVQVSASG